MWAIIGNKRAIRRAMKNINTNLRRLYYHVQHNYITTNNILVLIGLLYRCQLGGFSAGNGTMIHLQKSVDYKQRELSLAKLERLARI